MSGRLTLAAIGLLIATPAGAADPPHTTSSKLACGPARLQAQTTSIAHVPPDNGLVWTAQDITLSTAKGSSRPLHVEGVGYEAGSTGKGLSAIISGWQCLHGSHEWVIELWLTCNRADLGGTCGSQREWERLFDLSGQPLDMGYAPQDARYDALSRRLGIPEDRVRLQDALGD